MLERTRFIGHTCPLNSFPLPLIYQTLNAGFVQSLLNLICVLAYPEGLDTNQKSYS